MEELAMDNSSSDINQRMANAIRNEIGHDEWFQKNNSSKIIHNKLKDDQKKLREFANLVEEYKGYGLNLIDKDGRVFRHTTQP